VALECERWQWRELVASEHGPSDPSTRLVLFVLSLHMNQDGINAWPSQALIAKRTGLSERSVRTHVALAEKAEFLSIYQKRQPGKAWFVHEYVAVIPDRLEQFCTSKPWEVDPDYRRPAKSAGRKPLAVDKSGRLPARAANGAERPATDAPRAAIDDTTPGNLRHNARQGLPTNLRSENSSSNSPNNTPKKVRSQPTAPTVLNIEPKEPELEPEDPDTEKKAIADQAAKQQRQRKAAEERANRIKVALKAFPDYDDEGIRRASGVSLVEVRQLRRIG
jgi:hypothetical protein